MRKDAKKKRHENGFYIGKKLVGHKYSYKGRPYVGYEKNGEILSLTPVDEFLKQIYTGSEVEISEEDFARLTV